MSYDPSDPLGIGVSMSVTGFDASTGSSYTPSFKVLSDPAHRRKLLADLVKWLSEHRGGGHPKTYTFEQMLDANNLANLDARARAELFKDLRANAKVSAEDGEHIAYRATHAGIYNKADLLQYVHKFTHGIPKDELADAYEGVNEDIESLLSDGSVYSIDHLEKKRQILFPHVAELALKVDSDLKELWHSVVMPKTQVELEEKLYAAGHLSEAQYRAGHLEKSRQMQAAIKLAAGQKLETQAERRAKRKRYPAKVTNSHLIGAFDWFSPTPKAGAAGAAAGPAANGGK